MRCGGANVPGSVETDQRLAGTLAPPVAETLPNQPCETGYQLRITDHYSLTPRIIFHACAGGKGAGVHHAID
jgi:hypothetical protein